MSVRIEVRHLRDGTFVSSILEVGLRQATFARRDDALYCALQWAYVSLFHDREVDICEAGPRPDAWRWSAKGLRTVGDLRDVVERMRGAADLAERAIEHTVL